MTSKRVVLHFPNDLIDQPIIYLLSKKYNLTFNILLARIMPNEEGIMVAELSGEDEKYKEGIQYLREQGVNRVRIKQFISIFHQQWILITGSSWNSSLHP